tara:strand:- start:1152 stop:1511 length:360 start_codon:yes stop_codon:yes gene_type:complete
MKGTEVNDNTPFTKITMRTALVSPDELEIAWNTDEFGEVYTWKQVARHATLIGEEMAWAETVTYQQGVEMANEMLAAERTVPAGSVEVSQINITEKGGSNSFYASTMSPTADTIKELNR